MKNNISYYRHEVSSHNHWKFKTLRRKYTWSGEGKFWALNNIIADSPECKLDINDEDKKAAIAAELDFDVPEFESFVNYLIKVCKLVKMEEDMLITGITQEILSEVSEKRERQRNWKKEKSTTNNEKSTASFEESSSKTNVSTVEKQQSKLNNTKRNKSKVKKVVGHAPTKKKVFIPPDEKQVKEYFLSTIGNPQKNNPWPEDKCFNEASSFLDHYTANGWVQGRGKKIIDWKAACRNWIRNELKGSFKQSPAPERKNTPPPKLSSPPVDKIKNELSYLQDMFNEDESKVTIISIETEHYDYLKRNGKINFSAEKKVEIQQLATIQLNGNLNEKSLLNMMKRYGVIEYFKQQKTVTV